MIMETVFSDHVVNASDLRANQKRWLEEAFKNPITVNYSHRLLAIMNRDQVRDLFIRARYAELALSACQDLKKGRVFDEAPWLEYLGQKEREQFRDELLDSFMRASKTGDWNEVGDLLSDWKATAEVKRNPAIVTALNDAESPSDYSTVSQ